MSSSPGAASYLVLSMLHIYQDFGEYTVLSLFLLIRCLLHFRHQACLGRLHICYGSL